MKVAIYVRVSTDRQDYDKQIESCKRYCEMQGHDVYKIYSDIYTGKEISRPAFQELLNDMRLYKFKAVVCTRLDRVGRSLKHLINILEEFQNKGVEFIAITQNIDTTTSAGKLQMQILGAFAEFERNLISERTKEGLKGNVRVGKRGKDKRPRKKRGVLRKTPFTLGNKLS
jgi:DNA invertase Pin-like site-specific DNA recombinase